ncbi:MAG: glycosyltransferase, partial [Verrucomicrobiia bacterium]
MRVLFAPDYRRGVPYQARLAEALVPFGFEVEFLSDYPRGLPLYRGWQRAGRPSLVHLHWPEAYFYHTDWGHRAARVMRYRVDLSLLLGEVTMVLTAHNLYPHNRWQEFGVKANIRRTVGAAEAIFVHSVKAAQKMVEEFGISDSRCQVIP